MKKTRYALFLAAGSVMMLALTAGLAPAETQTATQTKVEPGNAGIQNGSTVQLEYRLSDEKGTVLDTNEGGDPLVYIHGEGQIIPGLEKALGGLRVGDTKHVVVSVDEAYGPIRPEAFVEVPKERIPEKSQTVGAHLMAQGQNGQTRHAFVKEIKEKTVVLDTNHPLAGKALTFDVKVVGIEPAQSK
ncbi:FKBP-type peptidyl-prolyl cis-trans isomerase SlyD [Candidatus Methylomirabilis lanthanidiphila]|uniref:Peptidyl-prolyl cis-trans isomerase n=1 Tax=Candidatus Methylomirabilis lanthanidiphila TaxID=2211376 RepID=A0A564ZL05_9BACT|nr:peptidylprolyl isomerase [Candidatus Methylomirabilis lanthanidiphila]VUZ85786.1 FKBP-type peptidyl-prolyl cis-trans isomerase SlyD [Candidatus Methylomirabilis lanthanidiphila]